MARGVIHSKFCQAEVMAGKAGLFRAMCQGRIQKPCDEQVVISSCHFKGHTCLKTDKTAWAKKSLHAGLWPRGSACSVMFSPSFCAI